MKTSFCRIPLKTSVVNEKKINLFLCEFSRHFNLKITLFLLFKVASMENLRINNENKSVAAEYFGDFLLFFFVGSQILFDSESNYR